ncbi:MAG: hypothetical protein ACI4JT_08755 [Oscillospiraceae bacterium]
MNLWEDLPRPEFGHARMSGLACGVVFEQKNREDFEQLSLFTDYAKIEREAVALEREKACRKR